MSNKMALDALTEIREALRVANETPNGPITDTIWMPGRPETLFDAFDAAIAALQAEPQGWMPIETAPKDAHALLWIDIAIGKPLVVQGCWFHDDDADEKGWVDLDGNVLNATHWMPLPATPPKD